MTVDVQLSGLLQERLQLALDQLRKDTPYSVELVAQDVVWRPDFKRIFQDYRGDLSGRYLSAVAVAQRRDPGYDGVKAAAILTAVLDSQQVDGSFGPPTPAITKDSGLAWGHGRLLDGLLDARQWVPSDIADRLEHSISRLSEYLISGADSWATWLRSVHSRKFLLDPLSVVRPLARIASSNVRAREAAQKLIDAAPADVTGLHMHGYLLFLRGRLALAGSMDDHSAIDFVEAAAQHIAENFMLPSGSILESFTTPWDVNTEGCGTADWVMLNLELHDARNNPLFLERANLAMYNGLLHSQAPSGHFGCETLAENGSLLMRDYGTEAWWCCTFHGIQAIDAYAQKSTAWSEGTLTLDSLASRSVHDDRHHLLDVHSPYPESGRVTMTVASPLVTTIAILVPQTMAIVSIQVDGHNVDAHLHDDYFEIDAAAARTITLDLRAHLWFSVNGVPQSPPFGNTTGEAPDLSTAFVSVYEGACLLAAHAPENPAEDILRARHAVHSRENTLLEHPESGVATIVAAGHDAFATRLLLRHLAHSTSSNETLVRIGFGGLLFHPRAKHSPEEAMRHSDLRGIEGDEHLSNHEGVGTTLPSVGQH